MDSQATEIIGRNWLVSQLVRDGLEVACPEHVHDVDLVAYLDQDETGGNFVAGGVQMKAATSAVFSLASKYEKFTPLILACVWHADEPERACAFALSYPEVRAVVDTMGWTTTLSWRRGASSTTSHSKRLRELLEPHRLRPGDLGRKVETVAVP
jgi:hypothetical protein